MKTKLSGLLFFMEAGFYLTFKGILPEDVSKPGSGDSVPPKFSPAFAIRPPQNCKNKNRNLKENTKCKNCELKKGNKKL